MRRPLADRLRPQVLNDVVGQTHILGGGKILKRMIESNTVSNMIFYGPPGTGKTTVANIIASSTNMRFHKLNATHASVKDIQDIVKELDTFLAVNGILLYLDEIQNFNKKQQQALLDFIETGRITLIASTTENPYFYVYKAILSRSTVFEFKLLTKEEIEKALQKGVDDIKKEFEDIKIIIDDNVLSYISEMSGGDLRKALNALEIAVYSTPQNKDGHIHIDIGTAYECTQKKILNYDRDGDSHYDILSAFQKSIRGSDVDAALHYLARLIKAGDLQSICRRLLVTASEDIGMAYPNAIVIVKSCVDSALQVGFPEARINLAQAVVTLATAPKSNSAYVGIDSALSELNNKDVGDIPSHIKDAHYRGAKDLGRGQEYKYPHAYEKNYVKQQYLPDNIKNSKYYIGGDNKIEKSIENYTNSIKK